jgi:hypothetical protein
LGVMFPNSAYATDSRACLATASAAGFAIQLSQAARDGSGAATRLSAFLRGSLRLRGPLRLR